VIHFESPEKSLGGMGAAAAATLIASAADVALILDGEGVIRDLAFGSEELSQEGYAKWRGQPWADTVTVESRQKVEELLRAATARSPSKPRHVNHPSSRGTDVPILYSALQVGTEGRVIAVGRDLRAISMLQQRLVDAQQSMERDYWRLRQVETRYRFLFQMAAEAVLTVDAATLKVVEANPAAGQLFGDSSKRLVGRTFPDGLDVAGTQSVEALLARVSATGRPDEVTVRLIDGKRELVVSASLFRQENAALFLVRCSALQAGASAQGTQSRSRLLTEVVERAPDGLVITDIDGRILTANPAFIDLAQLATEDQARGESLERWLGRPGVDLNVMISNLRQHGSVRMFATSLRGEHGSATEVEISAGSVLKGEQPCFGFSIRNVGGRLGMAAGTAQKLPRSVEQMTDLVGRVPLKELVRESTDLIERMCIEAALELTHDNRASAAEMLGLSRQSLYVKLRRYGLGDLAGQAEK
jgi:transcriptional regulator PpsR